MANNSLRVYGEESPYYAKYDPKKNYVKVLYNPGRALQAKELIDSQTYLENSIASFGNYFFKDGSTVNGAKITFTSKQPILHIYKDKPGSETITTHKDFLKKLENLKGVDVQDGNDNTIRIVDYYYELKDDKEATENSKYEYYLFFSYLTGMFDLSSSSEEVTLDYFTFYFTSGSSRTPAFYAYSSQTNKQNPTVALTAVCDEGTIFVDGFFLNVTKNIGEDDDRYTEDEIPHPAVIDILHYEDDPTTKGKKILCSSHLSDTFADGMSSGEPFYIPYSDITYYIGFLMKRRIITADEDETLLDPAGGTYNYKAPGANRQQVKPILKGYYYYNDKVNDLIDGIKENDNSSSSMTSFVSGIVIKDDFVLKSQSTDVNGALMDTLAQRTFEESGSYTVNPWKIEVEEAKEADFKNSELLKKSNLIISTTDTINPNDWYKISIQPGLGYIYGYRVSSVVSTELLVKKPRETSSKDNVVQYAPNGQYTFVQMSDDVVSGYGNPPEAKEFPKLNKMESVKLMDKPNGTGNEILPTGYTSNPSASELEKVRIKVVDASMFGRNLILYLTNTAMFTSLFSRAKSIAWGTNSYMNLRMDSNNCAELCGTDSPKIIPIGFNCVAPKNDNGSSSTQLTYTYTRMVTGAQSYNGDTIQVNLNTMSVGNNISTVSRSGLIAVIEESTGQPLDTSYLWLDVSDNGQSATIKSLAVNKIAFNGNYTVIYEVTEKGVTPRTKTIIKKTESISEANISDDIKLNECDVIKLLSVTVNQKVNQNGTNYKSDVLIGAEIDSGATDYVYGYSHIKNLKTALKNIAGSEIDTAASITVEYLYYEHSAGRGPFTSYSYVNDVNKSFVKEFEYDDMYANIPTYRSYMNNQVYKLRDCMDFRIKESMLNSSSNTNVVSSDICCFPKPDTSLIYSVTYYMPRIDKVYVDKQGAFGVNYGIPSIEPKAPDDKEGTMSIYYIINEAYVPTIKYITLKYIDNQRYTMLDIGKIDSRVKNLEDVVALNMLEQSAVNMQVTDENGLNRYKSGIFTDSFSSYDNSNYTNEEWNCSIDAVECSIRPMYECEEFGFKLNTSKSVIEERATNVDSSLPQYTTATQSSIGVYIPPLQQTVVHAKNVAVSETVNLQALMFYTWTGDLTLTPSVDTWVNDLGHKIIETYVETPKPPTTYRSWSVSGLTNVKVDTTQGSEYKGQGYYNYLGSYWYYNDIYRNDTTTTTGTQTTTTVTEATSYNGSWASSDTYTSMEEQDVYMRPIDITFDIKGMKPGLKIQARIDGRRVSLYDIDNNGEKIVDTVSDTKVISLDGTLKGIFTIPEKMTCGTKLVEFYDSDEKDSSSYVSAQYSANGKTVWTNVNRTYMRVWTAVSSTSVSQASKNVVLSTDTNQVFIDRQAQYRDPIAESFFVNETNGIVLESIELFFAKKDDTVGVNVQIVECENGYPSHTIVPYSSVTVLPKDIKVISKNDLISGAKKLEKFSTKFKFPYPLYLPPNKEYAFVVSSGSYNYEMYTSTLGAGDLRTGMGIQEQPYIGSMFKSQNNTTWTAEQLSDVTFIMNKYQFNKNISYVAYFDIDYDASRVGRDEFFADMETLAINTYVPSGTEIKLKYAFNEDYYYDFVNRQDIFNKTRNVLKIKTNEMSYPALRIMAIMKTSDSNITPFIDNEQVYGVFTYNKLKYQITQNKKTIEKEYESDYKKDALNLVRYKDQNGCFFYTGSYISNTVSLENDSYDLRVLCDAILPNGSYIDVKYKTKAYKPYYVELFDKNLTYYNFNFMNDKDDAKQCVGKTLRSYWYRYYTNTSNPSKSYYGFEKTSTSEGIRQVVCVLSAFTVNSDNVGKAYFKAINDPYILNVKANNTYKDVIYLIPENDGEFDYTDIDTKTIKPFDEIIDGMYIKSGTPIKYTNSSSGATSYWKPLKDVYFNTENEAIPKENSTWGSPLSSTASTSWQIWKTVVDSILDKKIPAGTYTIYNGYLWLALEDVRATKTPTEISLLWHKVIGIQLCRTSIDSAEDCVKEDPQSDWRKMIKEDNYTLSTETKSVSSAESSFVEYTYVPEQAIDSDFSEFALRIDMYSMTEIDVPRVKNLRAIALV